MNVSSVGLFRRITTMNIAVAYILISVFGGALGQVLLKRGMNGLGAVTLTVEGLVPTLFQIASSPFVIVGLAVYVCSTVFWLAALSRVDLSYAYPFASLSYVIMLAVSWQFFGEHISILRLLGSLMIGAGVLLISRS